MFWNNQAKNQKDFTLNKAVLSMKKYLVSKCIVSLMERWLLWEKTDGSAAILFYSFLAKVSSSFLLGLVSFDIWKMIWCYKKEVEG